MTKHEFPPHRWFAPGEEHSIFAESMDHPDVPDCVEYLSVAEHSSLLREDRARLAKSLYEHLRFEGLDGAHKFCAQLESAARAPQEVRKGEHG